jgi:hypothetical protein
MYTLNVLLTNGDVFARHYPTANEGKDAFDKMARNELVAYATLNDDDDKEIAVVDRCSQRACYLGFVTRENCPNMCKGSCGYKP